MGADLVEAPRQAPEPGDAHIREEGRRVALVGERALRLPRHRHVGGAAATIPIRAGPRTGRRGPKKAVRETAQ